MTIHSSTPEPFDWEAYVEAMAQDPDFDLFERFTFHHLSALEIEEIVCRMHAHAESLIGEAKALAQHTVKSGGEHAGN